MGALRELAAMPRPPLDILVEAAASADPEIAQEAQLLVSGLLRRWQRRMEADRGLGGVARQLGELAAALKAHDAAFSAADHPWLRKTAQKIMRLANRLPTSDAPAVAENCDAVLALVAARERSVAVLVNRELEAARPPEIRATSAPAQLLPNQRSATTGSAGASAQPELAPRGVSPFTTSGDADDEDAADNGGGASFNFEPAVGTPQLPEAMNQSQHRRNWQYPALDASPAEPIGRSPLQAGESSHEQPPSARFTAGKGSPPDVRPLENISSRELLRRWLDADGSEVLPFDAELTRRGFVRLSARLVEPLFSPRAEDRLRLVDDVLTEPGIDARPWLMLLSEDSAGDVRLLAVTIMATSDDAALIEKAWQVSIRDRDPRIAGLASRLRERRDSAQRK
jgi:hypothetical protein